MNAQPWSRIAAVFTTIALSPLLLLCAVAIRLEALLDRRARGPVLFSEVRISQGEPFNLLKFRTLNANALASLGEGPTHIKRAELEGELTRVGSFLKKWYLDELPQLVNVFRGEMALIGTRPWPIELYEAHIESGDTLKRDMKAGLIGPVSVNKGRPHRGLEADREYLAACKSGSWWHLLWLDVRIIGRAIRVVLEHKGL